MNTTTANKLTCEGCEREYSQTESDNVFAATSQETICKDCAQYYAYSQIESRFIEFDDCGPAVNYEDWADGIREIADRYADILKCGWPTIVE